MQASFAPLRAGRCCWRWSVTKLHRPLSATAYSLAQTFHRTLLVLHARGPAEASAFLNPGATTLEEFGVRAQRQISGALHREGRQSVRRYRGSDCAVPSQPAGGGG